MTIYAKTQVSFMQSLRQIIEELSKSKPFATSPHQNKAIPSAPSVQDENQQTEFTHSINVNGQTVSFRVRLFRPPEEIGDVNQHLVKQIIWLFYTNTPFILFDFSPHDVTQTIALKVIPKALAEDIFILNPLDFERPNSFLGDFKQNLDSNLIRLKSILSFLGRVSIDKELDLLRATLSQIFELYPDPIPLFKLLFLYDSNYLSYFLSQTTDDITKRAQYKNSLQSWNTVFNGSNLLKQYFTNPYFVRSTILNECPWKTRFLVCHFNLERIPIRDVKWMAESALIARLHSIADGSVADVMPSEIKASDLEGKSEAFLRLITNCYERLHDKYTLQRDVISKTIHTLDTQTMENPLRSLSRVASEKRYNDANIVIIDDDISMIDIEEIVRKSFSQYRSELTGRVNIYIQTGDYNNSTCTLPNRHSNVDDIAGAICQLSRLKWGRPSGELYAEFLEGFEYEQTPPPRRERFIELLQYALRPYDSVSEPPAYLLYRYLEYEKIKEIKDEYPLGELEDIRGYHVPESK
jgi:hypothetical protein